MTTDRPGRILAVEDEVDLARLVRLNLELAGHTVRTASNGVEGLAAVGEERPDLVLLDVMMPVMDGWEMLRRLKEDPQTEDIPVVMLTALAQERDFIRGHLQGAVRYVTKPFELATLLRVVGEALEPPDAQELQQRRDRVRLLLKRLAELDSGRSAGRPVRWSRIERAPAPARPASRPTADDVARLERLTDKQRYVAEQLAAGRSAQELAAELQVSRSNVYATRKRIARKLGVLPDDVATTMARLVEG